MKTRTTIERRCSRCGDLYLLGKPHNCRGTFSGRRESSDALTPIAEPKADEYDDLVGTVLGERYEILLEVNRGGMGVVYQARHVVLESLVAVKVLLRTQDEEAQRRFLLEAKLASKVKHPNTVFISDFGVLTDGRSYLVMEFLRGPTLGKLLREGPLDVLRACQIAVQAARGLSAVHDQGIVHRDLKPQTIAIVEKPALRFPAPMKRPGNHRAAFARSAVRCGRRALRGGRGAGSGGCALRGAGG